VYTDADEELERAEKMLKIKERMVALHGQELAIKQKNYELDCKIKQLTTQPQSQLTTQPQSQLTTQPQSQLTTQPQPNLDKEKQPQFQLTTQPQPDLDKEKQPQPNVDKEKENETGPGLIKKQIKRRLNHELELEAEKHLDKKQKEREVGKTKAKALDCKSEVTYVCICTSETI
jgi:hypothetical protein